MTLDELVHFCSKGVLLKVPVDINDVMQTCSCFFEGKLREVITEMVIITPFSILSTQKIKKKELAFLHSNNN